MYVSHLVTYVIPLSKFVAGSVCSININYACDVFCVAISYVSNVFSFVIIGLSYVYGGFSFVGIAHFCYVVMLLSYF